MYDSTTSKVQPWSSTTFMKPAVVLEHVVLIGSTQIWHGDCLVQGVADAVMCSSRERALAIAKTNGHDMIVNLITAHLNAQRSNSHLPGRLTPHTCCLHSTGLCSDESL